MCNAYFFHFGIIFAANSGGNLLLEPIFLFTDFNVRLKIDGENYGPSGFTYSNWVICPTLPRFDNSK